jgi:hypothetical protein
VDGDDYVGGGPPRVAGVVAVRSGHVRDLGDEAVPFAVADDGDLREEVLKSATLRPSP